MRLSTIPAVVLVSAIATVTLGCDQINPDITAAKKSLQSHLVDPGSVEYKDVRRYADGTVCGQYNAKNRMGGYTGFESFIYWKGQQISSSHVADNLLKLCSDDKDKVEVTEEKIDVDIKSTGNKTISARIYLYVDSNNPMIILEKRDTIESKVRKVFAEHVPKGVSDDQFDGALSKAFTSDKELAAIKRARYFSW